MRLGEAVFMIQVCAWLMGRLGTMVLICAHVSEAIPVLYSHGVRIYVHNKIIRADEG